MRPGGARPSRRRPAALSCGSRVGKAVFLTSLRRLGLNCLSRAGGSLVGVRSGCTGEVAPEGVGEVNGEEGCVVSAGSSGSTGTVLKPGSSSSMPVSSSRDEAVFGVAGEATSVRGVPKASRGEDGASGGGAR